jgi:hypothetical protein
MLAYIFNQDSYETVFQIELGLLAKRLCAGEKTTRARFRVVVDEIHECYLFFFGQCTLINNNNNRAR